tara:strand:+ start:75 stop:713 length:639 start_codon:yes stop_codon:yes gene_type:complete
MLRSIVLAVGLGLAASACVSTPASNSAVRAEIPLTENEQSLRQAVRALDARYEEAGWSVGTVGQTAMRFASMLMNGGGDDPAPSGIDGYLEARAESAGADLAQAVTEDVREARELAAAVTTASMAINNAGLVNERERLAADLALTERAIADVRRAVELFESVEVALAPEMDETQMNALNAQILTLRQEFVRMGEAADALSARRRALPGSLLG